MIARLNAALEGRYQVRRQIGEGGMATVFLADDVRHDRLVALKVLRPELAAVIGAERFLTEIRVTAGLRHPNILPLFDSGEADGFLFYVMPYVEGESLRDRLDRERQLPVADAVRIAVSIANALEHAHRKGVIHRDVKPANIMLQDGEPVVADFGIALAVDGGQGRLTETGLSIGTPFYMSPEQATGDGSVGPASDVYALACVLYEMLAGQPPHGGVSAQAVLARIIAGDADPVRRHRPTTPAHVEAALRKALERLPPDRFASAERFAGALTDPGFRYGADPEGGPSGGAFRRLRLVTAGALAVAAVATAVAVGALARSGGGEGGSRVLRQDLTIGVDDPRLRAGKSVVSDDGRRIVYNVSDRRGVSSIFVRDVTELQAEPMPGTDGARRISVSPASDEVAFNTVGLGPLRVAPLDGGPVRVLTDAAQGQPVWGGDHLYFVDAELGISRVPIEGGEVERVTPIADDGLVRGPSDVLPGGDILLFTEFERGGDRALVRALSLDDGEMTTVTAGMGGIFRDGLLIYAAESQDRIMGVSFDPETLEVRGREVTLVSGVTATGPLFGGLVFDVSRSGDLIHATAGRFGEGMARPVWVDRPGNVSAIPGDWNLSPVMAVSGLALSYDGAQLAVASGGSGDNDVELLIHDLSGGPVRRLSFEAPVSTRPFWGPDDREVFFFRDSTASFLEGELVALRADGSGEARSILPSVGLGSGSWSRDGTWMVYRVGVPARPSRDIFALRAGDTEPIELVATDATEQAPSLSPDGRWLLYQSDRSGQHEVYVRPFPDVDAGLQQISLEGGTEPRWAHSGREIFYRDDEGRMVAAQVESTPGELRVSRRDLLFDATPFWSDPAAPQYDVAPDDQRFLMLEGQAGVYRLVVTWNWLQEARAMVEEANR